MDRRDKLVIGGFSWQFKLDKSFPATRHAFLGAGKLRLLSRDLSFPPLDDLHVGKYTSRIV